MNRRVRLTPDDVELIAAALDLLHNSSIVNEKVFPEYGYASRQRIGQIKTKMEIPTSHTEQKDVTNGY